MESQIDYGSAFTYVPKETGWLRKSALMGLSLFVPLMGFFLHWGYMVETMRRVIAGETPSLPEWTNPGDILKKGLKAWLVTIVYALPMLVLLACALLPIAATSLADTSQDNSTWSSISSIVLFGLSCLAAIYSIPMMVIIPAAFGKLAATDEVKAALRVGEVLALIRAKPAAYIGIAIASAVANFVLICVGLLIGSIGLIVCGIGLVLPFYAIGYANLVSANLYAQAYRVASASA